ncbi:MAG: aminotransferase class V-fold PLP-dependent enzyme [Rhodospirillaceae bacterium]|jgi:alanine-glyoxylate transaminase/serine-glyoxylate transaminase/serine-pyruvate transaminase|nr:aminotransferase class V-fold PLP-dependent enzyme [Rhodospirillaceae bacterium]MBT3908370.1 aminotransferase class V-fold PLP-dependent enzyme [Rhodospirillaceae bacterium]MBT5298510.1 aminotransferase class V-fold PLP-dependent enzyme [Rhodospirillaceae bacterium]MBT5512801.1 aminotransferase class V-fold PLP-dependent enzyme [Rhodospirillaceae bacterium]MBT6087409.1 aminotransferase class V-fold PLP-dependent enzyme [Rhodospirillaceae bacterium]
MSYKSGRHFLQIPGPSNVPDRILRAMDYPTMDHRGPDFGEIGLEILAGVKKVFGTDNHVIVYPSSGTGAWEAALVNTLSPGDKVLMFETGQFATLWQELAEKHGLEVEFIDGDWRHGVDAGLVEEKLKADSGHSIKAVCMVHNETSTGVASNIATARQAMDAAGHPALLMIDTISSLGSLDYRHDDWGVDITVSCSQKGLMLPPGLGFNAISDKALEMSKSNGFTRSYWDWQAMITNNASGFFPYTPATNLLYGLREALKMLDEEGLENVFARHDRMAEATRRAIQAWGLEVLCQNPDEYSSVLTAVMVPDGVDADHVRGVILDNFDMSLGTGLGKVKGKVFRIGHLGDFNELTLMGTLAGVEMGLSLADVPHQKGGVDKAMAYLTETAGGAS